MAYRLTTRLDLNLNLIDFPCINLEFSHENFIDALALMGIKAEEVTPLGKRLGPSQGYLDKTTDYQITVKVISPAEFYKFEDFNSKQKCVILESAKKIALIEIENFVSFKDEPAETGNARQHSFLALVAKKILPEDVDFTVVKAFDHKTKQRYLEHDNIIDDKKIGAKYRLFLDHVLVSERFYPYELGVNEQLEEVFLADLEQGSFRIYTENLTNHMVYITDFAIDDEVRSNLNTIEQTFQIR